METHYILIVVCIIAIVILFLSFNLNDDIESKMVWVGGIVGVGLVSGALGWSMRNQGKNSSLIFGNNDASAIPNFNVDDFANEPYDLLVDDQKHLSIADDEQEYLSRDYSESILGRFPIFGENDIVPQITDETGKMLTERSLANNYLRKVIPTLVNTNWSNQTASYMRLNTIGKNIIDCIIKPAMQVNHLPSHFRMVDATANVGGDSLRFAMCPFVTKVDSYEILPLVYNMLVKNVKLYGLDKIKCHNSKFDYSVQDALVIIDPPYESGNNIGNFNLSIDNVPIYEVCGRCLREGALAVLLTMPKTFVYNLKYAVDNNQHVTAFRMASKNNKIFLIMPMKNNNLTNFQSKQIVPDKSITNKSGKANPWFCVVEDVVK